MLVFISVTIFAIVFHLLKLFAYPKRRWEGLLATQPTTTSSLKSPSTSVRDHEKPSAANYPSGMRTKKTNCISKRLSVRLILFCFQHKCHIVGLRHRTQYQSRVKQHSCLVKWTNTQPILLRFNQLIQTWAWMRWQRPTYQRAHRLGFIQGSAAFPFVPGKSAVCCG